MRNRLFLSALIVLFFHFSAFAFTPKRNDGSGINDGTSSTETTESRIPIGLPFQYTDVNTGGGGGENGGSSEENSTRIVYSFDLTEEIGPASFRQTHSALEQARRLNAACVLVRIDSYEGALDAAENIRSELESYDRPVLIYVDGKAVSAAALISMSGDSLYMRKGSSIQGKSKTSSSVKSTHVTPDKKTNVQSVAATSISGNNTSTISSAEAVNNHLANAETNDIHEALARAGVNDCELVYYSPGFVEKLIDWCMNPAVSLSILVLLSFAVRIQQEQTFPGPATFLLLATIPFFTLPLYQGGLGKGYEIIFLLVAIILALLPAFRRSPSRIMRLLPFLLLATTSFLCLSGSLRSSGLNDLLLLAACTLSALLCGWLLLPFLSRFITASKKETANAVAVS